ncbi:unnamed protein product [Paramecium sonneborni]|uniref:WD40-repeat-containing domain n=1 Tax=Paramecium sonneborni TaxID=65129 RepID=A0A8S1RRE2_9CILI|nr:unnamed protein product [Paramecium sonneborni]
MIQIKVLEKENLRCSQNHNALICSIDVEKDVQMNERLLCSECMLNIRSDNQMLDLNIIESQIENNIKDNLQKKISFISQKKEQLTKLYNYIDQQKSTFNKTIDSIKIELNYQIDSLIAKEQANYTYNFIQELDNFINQSQSHEKDYELLVESFIKSNNASINKMQFILTKFNSDYRKYITQIKDSLLEIIQIQSPKITLKPINNQLKQQQDCWAIAFNYTGQIMVSGCSKDIKVWDFKDGQIQEVQKLQVHKQTISCLLFSKIQNSFISGSGDNIIGCWKQVNGQEWKCQLSYEQHTGWIQCLLLCKNENILFSGGQDKTIKIWQVDFDNNNLKFSYSLMKHTQNVFGLSLNESETILVSCGADQQIITWKKTKKNKWEFYQIAIMGNIQKYFKQQIYHFQIQQQQNIISQLHISISINNQQMKMELLSVLLKRTNLFGLVEFQMEKIVQVILNQLMESLQNKQKKNNSQQNPLMYGIIICFQFILTKRRRLYYQDINFMFIYQLNKLMADIEFQQN